MKFATAAAFFAATVAAGSVDADSTVYETQLVTISRCPETVTDCPLESKTMHVTTSMVPMTTSTIYTTNTHTITSCGPEVVSCPAHSTVIKTEIVPVSTTVCPVTATQTPVTSAPWGNSTVPVATSSCETTAVPTGPAECKPSHSVTAITKSYTTVLTSVEYSTVEIPCPTKAPVCPGGENCPPPALSTGAPVCPGPNCVQPTGGNNGTTAPPVTGGAAAFTGSAVFAAVAGLAAFILA